MIPRIPNAKSRSLLPEGVKSPSSMTTAKANPNIVASPEEYPNQPIQLSVLMIPAPTNDVAITENTLRMMSSPSRLITK